MTRRSKNEAIVERWPCGTVKSTANAFAVAAPALARTWRKLDNQAHGSRRSSERINAQRAAGGNPLGTTDFEVADRIAGRGGKA